jgi:hypothetical protein
LNRKITGRNTPAFTTLTTVRITGRVQEYDGDTVDDGAMRAELALESLREQVERAVINSYELTRNIQKYAEVRSTINVDSEGEAHMGQLLFEIDIEHYQGRKIFILSSRFPLRAWILRSTCQTAQLNRVSASIFRSNPCL